MYADDLALAATAPEELQAMLNIVAQYAHTWWYRLNPTWGLSGLLYRVIDEQNPASHFPWAHYLLCIKQGWC